MAQISKQVKNKPLGSSGGTSRGRSGWEPCRVSTGWNAAENRKMIV